MSERAGVWLLYSLVLALVVVFGVAGVALATTTHTRAPVCPSAPPAVTLSESAT